MDSAEIRESFLKFFEEKGCKRMPSSSLIPDDPSMLLTSAGMVQFKPYFLQQKQLEEPFIGTTTVQKCLRTSDIDNIGRTGRHLSFFEMLGNFSFGKYFKKEMCAWALEYTLDVLKFPMDKLHFSVFEDDDETIEIWQSLGVAPDRIVRLGADDNFWTAGPTGPCGPCSELYYDQGEECGCGSPDCAPGCDCDRFIEFWNCVFTQYDRQEDGTLVPLPKKNIDTGMGLERVAALVQGKHTNYESDILIGMIKMCEEITGRTYGESQADDMAMRIIADHSRAVTFMIGDGILPSNEGRGYVLRRLLRRAVRYGHLLGIEEAFLGKFVDEVVSEMGCAYPEIVENHELISRIVLAEEERFRQTLSVGQAYLAEEIDALEGDTLSGRAAFTLHDTYGFPFDLTLELCSERGIKVDEGGFKALMEEQRERARSHVKDLAWSTYEGLYPAIVEEFGETEFIGYDNDECEAKVVAIVADGQRVEALEGEGAQGEIFLSVTPFYGEMGGQVGDIGKISCGDAIFDVTDAQRPEHGLISHVGKLCEGRIEVGSAVSVQIDRMHRSRIERNHTATHILHYALRQVLGDHVKQAGSLVAPNRLRFDFTHFESMTPEQIAEVERIVNGKIMADGAVSYHESSLASAREAGVTALFGEKYGEVVRVLECGDYSKELCGGCHVRHTSEIGFFKIVSETSVAANTRRIEAVTSYDALEYVNRMLGELDQAASALKVSPTGVVAKVESNAKRIKELEAELKRAKSASAAEGGLKAAKQESVEGAFKLEISLFEAAGIPELKDYWDAKKAKAASPFAVFCASKNAKGEPVLLAAGNDGAVSAGFDASAAIKALAPTIAGRGGGKPAMAQAGGKDAAGLEQAFDEAKAFFGA